jgi:hypothetical protein
MATGGGAGAVVEFKKKKEPERFSHVRTPKGVQTVPHETVVFEYVHCKGCYVYSPLKIRRWSKATPGPWCTECGDWPREPQPEGWTATGRSMQLAYKGRQSDYQFDKLRLWR